MKKTFSQFWYGVICCFIAEASYGVNGYGAEHLYRAGFDTPTVLFFRFFLASCILALFLLFRREPIRTDRRDILVGISCGFLFCGSALPLYLSFKVMDTGLACTLLFVYPIFVVIMSALLFKERITWQILLTILVAGAGIGLLSGTGSGHISLRGFILVMLSAASYAVYMIVYQKWPPKMSQYKMTFFSTAFSAVGIVLYSLLAHNPIRMPSSPATWGWAVFLAIIPTVISVFFTVESIKYVGSTLTATLGALEPLTAIVLGVAFLGEPMTVASFFGSLLVLGAVIFAILQPNKAKG